MVSLSCINFCELASKNALNMSQWKVTALSKLTSVRKIHTRFRITFIFTIYFYKVPLHRIIYLKYIIRENVELFLDLGGKEQVIWKMTCVQYRWYLRQPPHYFVNKKVFDSYFLMLSASCDIIFTIHPRQSLMHIFFWDCNENMLLRILNRDPVMSASLYWYHDTRNSWYFYCCKHIWSHLDLLVSLIPGQLADTYDIAPGPGQCLLWMSWNYPWNIISPLLHSVLCPTGERVSFVILKGNEKYVV